MSSIRDIRNNLLRFLIFAGYGIIHGVVPAIIPPELLNSDFSPESRDEAALFAFVSAVCLAAGWYAYEAYANRHRANIDELLPVVTQKKALEIYQKLFWVSMVLGLAGWAIYVKGTGATLSQLASSGRFEFRLQGNAAIMTAGTHLSSLAFVPGFLCFFLPRNYRLTGIAFTFVLAVACFFVLAKGTRAVPLGLLGGLGVAYTFRNPVSPGRFFQLIAGCLLLAWLTISLYEVRKVMQSDSVGQLSALLVQPETYQKALLSDPLNYHQHLVGAIDTFPRKTEYMSGATYLRILFFMVPSSLIPGLKPDDTNKLFAEAVYNTDPDIEVTIPPSIPGDAYVNWWGWPGILMMLANGLILAWGNRKMLTKPFWFIALGPQFARFSLLVLRGQPYELFVTLLLVSVSTWVLLKLCNCSLSSLLNLRKPSYARKASNWRSKENSSKSPERAASKPQSGRRRRRKKEASSSIPLTRPGHPRRGAPDKYSGTRAHRSPASRQ